MYFFYGTPFIFPSFGTSHVDALLRVQVLTYNTGMVAYSKQSQWQQAGPTCLRHAGGNFCIWAATQDKIKWCWDSVTYMTWL